MFSKRFPKTSPYFWDNDWSIWKFLFRHTYIFWSKILTFFGPKAPDVGALYTLFFTVQCVLLTGYGCHFHANLHCLNFGGFQGRGWVGSGQRLKLNCGIHRHYSYCLFHSGIFPQICLFPKKMEIYQGSYEYGWFDCHYPILSGISIKSFRRYSNYWYVFLKKNFGYFFSMKKSYFICKLFPPRSEKKVKINFSNFTPHLDFTLHLQTKWIEDFLIK